MNLIPRGWSGVSALVLGGLGLVISAGSMAGACALPGYTLGDTTTGSSGAGGAGGSKAGAGGDTAAASVGSSGGAGGGQTTGTDGAGGSGGSTGKPCGTVQDCGMPADPCTPFECNNGQCMSHPEDGPLPAGGEINPAGDCNKAVCNAGHLEYQPDDSDKPVAPSPCYANECANGLIDHTLFQMGAPCTIPSTNMMGKCDAEGKCIECLGPADCQSCTAGKCVTDGCLNQMQDLGETGLDCGGPCAPCPPGKGCKTNVDCSIGACDNMVCIAPTPSDGVQNNNETDIDCGGNSGNVCAIGQHCESNSDCASLLCKNNACQFTCGDDIKDGKELGVDCGGPICKFVACPP